MKQSTILFAVAASAVASLVSVITFVVVVSFMSKAHAVESATLVVLQQTAVITCNSGMHIERK